VPEDNSQEVLDLKKKVEELEDKLRKVGLEVPAGIEGLSKGSDKFSIEFSFETKNPKLGKNGITYWIKGDEYDHSIETTWDLLFSYLAPEIISPTSEYESFRV
jgi:hypothetical protein